jgi:hypothetical protein
MVRLLAVGLAVVSAIGLPLLGGFYLVFAPGESGCEQRQVFAEAVSPDGLLIARFYQNVCGGGLGTTYVDDTVEIARPNETPHSVPAVGWCSRCTILLPASQDRWL